MSTPPPVKTPRLQDTLQLDRRARAMLKAMGIQWFWPSAPPSAAVAAPPAPDPAAMPAPVSEPTVYAPVATAARAAVPPLRPVETTLEPMRETPPTSTRAPVSVDGLSWETLATQVASCQSCGLCEGRSGGVTGWGAPTAKWVFVADHLPSTETNDAPVGPSELTLFEAICQAMALTPADVYLTSLTKCRAAPGMAPTSADVTQCLPYLHAQLAWLQPQMIVAMGLPVAQALLPAQRTQGRALGQLRGQVHPSGLPAATPVVVTYPLSALLRNSQEKPKTWADLCLAMAEVDARAPGS